MTVHQVVPYGRSAFLVTPSGDVPPLDLAQAIAGAERPDIAEIVPAAATVLVIARGDAAARLDGWLAGVAAASTARREFGDVELDVVYDGDDLEHVARECRMSVDEVVERHAVSEYRCEFCGFAPGFGYLSGLDARLHLPRRTTPRVRVPAGSVAIAGAFSAAYPTASPGGWHLLGRTDARLWDVDRPEPALLSPGRRVRFRPVGKLSAAPAATEMTRPRLAGASPSLVVVSPGIATTVQDLGRPGYAAVGVPAAGAVDRASLELVNRLVGNDPSAATFETAGGLVVEALRPTTVADSATGSVRSLVAGERLRIDPRAGTSWAYVAVRGGLDVAETLGSTSFDTLSDIGPRPPDAGTTYGTRSGGGAPIVADMAPQGSPTSPAVMRLDAGPRADWFAPASITALTSHPWRIGAERSRVGVRLDGPPLVRADDVADRELASEGLIIGAVQVPPDGRPVVMLNDHPVTGGYPVIAVVDPADLPTLAQLPAGSELRFATR